MVKKTYRKFSKKGLSKKNKLRRSKRKSLRSKRKSRKHGGDKPCGYVGRSGLGQGLKEGTPEYIICQAKKVKAYSNSKRWGDKERLEDHKKKLTESIKIYSLEGKGINLSPEKIENIIQKIEDPIGAITIIDREVAEQALAQEEFDGK